MNAGKILYITASRCGLTDIRHLMFVGVSVCLSAASLLALLFSLCRSAP